MIATLARRAAALVAFAALAACSASSTLPQGLTAEMDRPGASLDRAEAMGLINQFRASRSATPLATDTALNAQAQELADNYASSGTAPSRPDNATGMLLSAGYTSFAETFSGWRGVPADAQTIAEPLALRAGLATAYNPSSQYGVYWVLLLAGPDSTIMTSAANPGTQQ